MGQNLSQEINEKENDQSKATQVVQLRKKEGEMRQKYEEKKAKLYIEALNDECLPIVCAVDTFYEFLLIDPDGHDQQSYGRILEAIMEKHLQGDLKGFVELVEGVVKRVFEQSTKVVEEKHMHVVSANKSVLRIDYYLYLNKSDFGNTLFYFVQVGVVDMTRVRPAVLKYELTRATQSEKVKEASNKMQEMAESSKHMYVAVQVLVKTFKDNEASTTGGGSPPISSRRQADPDPIS